MSFSYFHRNNIKLDSMKDRLRVESVIVALSGQHPC